MTITSFEAAKKLCHVSNFTISNLKLQKLLYLSHLVYVGRYKEPLVNELFEAWEYGPVLPSVYKRVNCFGTKNVEDIFYAAELIKEGKEVEIIEQVYSYFGNHKASRLVGITHRENGAWAKNYNSRFKRKISHEDVLKEYETVNSSKY